MAPGSRVSGLKIRENAMLSAIGRISNRTKPFTAAVPTTAARPMTPAKSMPGTTGHSGQSTVIVVK
jgi:hypothetical protein